MPTVKPVNAIADRPGTSPRYWVGNRVEIIDGYAWADFIPRRGDIIPVCLGRAEDVLSAARGEASVPEGLSDLRRNILARTIEEAGENRSTEASEVRPLSLHRIGPRGRKAGTRQRGNMAR